MVLAQIYNIDTVADAHEAHACRMCTRYLLVLASGNCSDRCSTAEVGVPEDGARVGALTLMVQRVLKQHDPIP